MLAVRNRGQEAAFEELVRRHSGRALRVARACLGSADAAEDAVQESFLKLVRARGSYRRGSRFAPWFYALLRNACRDELRRLSRRCETVAAGERIGTETDLHLRLIRRDEGRVAARAFGRLAEIDRDILALRIHGGLDFSAIARSVGLSEEATKKRAYRALDSLRREISRRS